MIRKATVADIPRIVEMCVKFVEMAWHVPPCEKSMARTVKKMIKNPDALVLVGEKDGALFSTAGAVVYPWHFNHSVLAGQEMWWWSEGSQAKDMIRYMEEWALSKGATTFAMGRINGMRDQALDRVFCRLGYRPQEHLYMRSLGDGRSNRSGDNWSRGFPSGIV